MEKGHRERCGSTLTASCRAHTKMKPLSPPFLELAYYVGREQVARCLERLKADLHLVGDGTSFQAANAIGLARDREQVVIRGGIIEIRTEGERFCGPPGGVNVSGKVRHRVYERFLHFAELLEPAYGAIVVEYSLEEPAELLRDSRSLAFRNFYLGEHHIDPETIATVIQLVGHDCYIEHRRRGAYISMSKDFNPDRRGIDGIEAQKKSGQIAKILSRAAPSSSPTHDS